MIYLRQSTASQEIVFGPALDSTDGNTEETGLTIANTDIEIYKAGATTHVDKNSGGATHSSKGMYSMVFDATDTDTIGSGKAYIHVAGMLACVVHFTVLDEAVYDVLFGTTAPSTLAAGALMGLADDAITAAKIDTGAIVAATFAAGAIDAAAIAAGAIDNATFAADVGSTAYATNIIALAADKAIQNAALPTAAAVADIPTVAEFNARSLPSADYTIVSDLPAAPDNAGIAAIKAKTDNLPTDPADQSLIIAATDSILTAVADVPTVAEFNARTLLAADYTVVSDLPVAPDNASITAILEDTGTTLPAAIAALPTDADVNAACDTAISDAALATAASVAAIPVVAKKNTALANFAFIMTDLTNHETAPGMTVTCTRSIDGSAFAAGTLANVTEISSGVYNVDFLAADLNGDVVVLQATATGCDDTFVTIVTAK